MTCTKSARFAVFPLVLLLSSLAIFFASPALAADPDDRPAGFRFHAPRIFIGGHAGMNFPQADSDFYSFLTSNLTLQKSDFRGPFIGFDVGVPIHPHFALVGTFDYGRVSPQSEFRHFVEDNGNPITQTTRFSQISLIGTLRYYPWKMGETVGSYAWVPRRILPYVAGGAGMIHYNLTQFGDFVDSTTYNIFSATFESNDYGLIKHAAAGVDIGITSRVFANLEGRYSFANAGWPPNRWGLTDFRGYRPLDLSGLKLIGGIYFRF